MQVNYILMIDGTHDFSDLDKGNGKTRLEIFKFWDLVRLISEVWWYYEIIQTTNGDLLQLQYGVACNVAIETRFTF